MEYVADTARRVARTGDAADVQRLRECIAADPSMTHRATINAVEVLRSGADQLGAAAESVLSDGSVEPFVQLYCAEQLASARPDLVLSAITQLTVSRPALLLALASQEAVPAPTMMHLRQLVKKEPAHLSAPFLRAAIRRSNLQLDVLWRADGGRGIEEQEDQALKRPATLCHTIPKMPMTPKRSRTHALDAAASSDATVLAVLLAHEAFEAAAVRRLLHHNRRIRRALSHHSVRVWQAAEAARFRLVLSLVDAGLLPSSLIQALPDDFDPEHSSELATSAQIRTYLDRCSRSGTVPDLPRLSQRLSAALEQKPDIVDCVRDHADYLEVTPPPSQPPLSRRWSNLANFVSNMLKQPTPTPQQRERPPERAPPAKRPRS